MNNTLTLNKIGFKTQILAGTAATAAAVALPQIFHFLGMVSGTGTALGEAFLPMHLPVLLVGFLAGPFAGALAGALSPLVSFMISGMPPAFMLPFMLIELAGYGLAAGMLRGVKVISFGKVLAAQIAGRILRAAAILTAVYLLGVQSVGVPMIWSSIATGLFGVLLQLTLIPLILFWAQNRERKHS